MSEYKILKVPLSKDVTIFYYYKPYKPSADSSLMELPEGRTIQINHFDKPIKEEYLKKYFGLAGKIKEVHLGEHRNRSNNKKKRRIVYFGLVVFKTKEQCELALNGSFLQSKVNQVCKRALKFTLNGSEFDNTKGENDQEEEKDEQTQMLEDGGFTVVKQEEDGPDRKKVTDGEFTTVHGISQEEARRYVKENFKAQQVLERIHGDEGKTQTEMKKQKRKEKEALLQAQTATAEFDPSIVTTNIDQQNPLVQNAFYKFQAKHVRKAALSELKRGFEDDKKRIEKMQAKRAEKELKRKIQGQ